MNQTKCLNLKKAFDTVDHAILVKKLQAYGIRGTTGNWFESYLENRKQFCALNGQKSKIKNIPCGKPQGSCLGPLLFIIYLNDFEKCLKFSRASIYADDTHISIVSNDLERLVINAQQELLNVSECMRFNKLSSNPRKTGYMIIGHPYRTNSIEITDALLLNDSEIKRVAKSKSLGVIIDRNVKWDEQFKSAQTSLH